MKISKRYFMFVVFSLMCVVMFSFEVSAFNNISSCQPIFLSGEYVLTKNIDNVNGIINCLAVNVSDVTIDCRGFSLNGGDIIYGIDVLERNNVTIKNCVLRGFDYGIRLNSASNCSIIDNNISLNAHGIRIQAGNSNILTGNLINDNSEAGIVVISSSDNEIYNNFLINMNNAKISGSLYLNYWNSSSEGNYWKYTNVTGYSKLCRDDNVNNICDVEYMLTAVNNTDYLPLKNCPICPPEVNYDKGGGSDNEDEEDIDTSVTYTELIKGEDRLYSQGEKLSLNMREENHTFSVTKIRSSLIEINVSSTPQQAVLFIGETKKFSFSDRWYNLTVTLNDITESSGEYKANVTLFSINEPIFLEERSEEVKVCTESWECQEWGKCSDGMQIRTCIDLNNCNADSSIPITQQVCEKSNVWVFEVIYFFIGLTIILLIVILIRWGRKK